MIKFPEQYKEICRQFISEYYSRRKWEIEQGFLGVILPHPVPDEVRELPGDNEIKVVFIHQSALADQLAEIARAAAGEIDNDSEGWNRGAVYEGIQDLCERLFAPPGLGAAYQIPGLFWDTPLGGIVIKALVWASHDELITQTEAADMLGIKIQSVNNYIREGKLNAYRNPDANNTKPHTPGGILLRKSEVYWFKRVRDGDTTPD